MPTRDETETKPEPIDPTGDEAASTTTEDRSELERRQELRARFEGLLQTAARRTGASATIKTAQPPAQGERGPEPGL